MPRTFDVRHESAAPRGEAPSPGATAFFWPFADARLRQGLAPKTTSRSKRGQPSGAWGQKDSTNWSVCPSLPAVESCHGLVFGALPKLSQAWLETHPRVWNVSGPQTCQGKDP
jgi:hypothetical protein